MLFLTLCMTAKPLEWQAQTETSRFLMTAELSCHRRSHEDINAVCLMPCGFRFLSQQPDLTSLILTHITSFTVYITQLLISIDIL